MQAGVSFPLPAFHAVVLDAIHLASALAARKAVSDVAVLSLDDRIRKTAGRLGFPLSPVDADLQDPWTSR